MLVDLKIDNRHVVVVGGGAESYRKVFNFVEAGAKVLVVSKEFSDGIQTLHRTGKICLQKEEIINAEEFINSFDPKPELLIALTNDNQLNIELIKNAKDAGCMVYAPDNPSTSDFILPAIARVEDVRIAISTSGKSPAMASLLRQRIEKIITPEDILQIKLQNYLRQALRGKIPDQKIRRQHLYRVMEDQAVQRLLKEGKLEEAKKVATKVLGKE